MARLIADVTAFMSFASRATSCSRAYLPARARLRAGQRYEIRIAGVGSLANRLQAA